MATRKIGHHKIVRIKNGSREEMRDVLANEAAATVFVNRQEIVTLLCTPSDFGNLAVGYLFSEGIVKSADDVRAVAHDPAGGVVNVDLHGELPPEAEVFEHRALTTGCGRGTMFYALQDQTGLKKVQSKIRIPASKISELMHALQGQSEMFLSTGAVHSAALADANAIIYVGEDVGRHNAVDKVIGRAVIERMEMNNKILLTSGRISSEILSKTVRAGIPILVSRSAPTLLAVQFAQRLGVTLAGFVRGGRMNIYTHENRIID
jgi:FdhD protein